MTDDRIKEIIRTRNNKNAVKCLDVKCPKMIVDNMSFKTMLAFCTVHDWKEVIAGEKETVK